MPRAMIPGVLSRHFFRIRHQSPASAARRTCSPDARYLLPHQQVAIRSVRAKNHKNDQLSRKERISASQPEIAPSAIKDQDNSPHKRKIRQRLAVTHLSVRSCRNPGPAHSLAASSRLLLSKQPEQSLTKHICLDTRPDSGPLKIDPEDFPDLPGSCR